MKKVLLGVSVGMVSMIVMILAFVGIVAHDNTYNRNCSASNNWGW